ncbi:ankyrin [Thozetella sp. PMI_491]|nr:ankyrin [Thozetella sp. PMI_491]
MASAISNPIAGDWDKRKETILNLARNHRLKDVMQIMENDGFSASRSQYETQFLKWGQRKNLKRHEWNIVLSKLNQVTSQGEKARVLISGQPVPDHKLKREMRRCSQVDGPRGRITSLQGVSIEKLGADNQWVQVLDFDPTKVPSDHRSRSSTTGISQVTDNIFGNYNFGGHSEYYDRGCSMNHSVVQSDDSYALPLTYTPVHLHFDLPEAAQTLLPQSSLAIPAAPFELSAVQSLPLQPGNWNFNLDFSDPFASEQFLYNSDNVSIFYRPMIPYSVADQLPFARFERDLPIRVIRSAKSNFASSQNGGNHANIDSVEGLVHNLAVSASAMDDKQLDIYTRKVRFIIKSLDTLLPNWDTPFATRRAMDLMTEDGILESKIYRSLLFSIANGFVGLKDLPIEGVLKLLRQHGTTRSLIWQYLGVNKSCFARSFAENLFRATIEAKDPATMRHLISLDAFDINKIVCTVHGNRYTPLERAVRLLDEDGVTLLLSSGTDVNRSMYEGGALYALVEIEHIDKIHPKESIIIAEKLLDYGIQIDPKYTLRFFESFSGHGVAFRVAIRLLDANLPAFLSQGMLYAAVDHLDRLQCAEIMPRIFDSDDRAHTHILTTIWLEQVEPALIKSAMKGYTEVVRTIMPHYKHPHRILSAAIRNGDPEVIDAVLAVNPEPNPQAHSIDLGAYHDYGDWEQRKRGGLAYTTPLAEALEARNAKLIQKSEDAGALTGLEKDDGRFQAAITAASKIGDLLYVRKLLHHQLHPKPSDMERALYYAYCNGHQEIFSVLLRAGAKVDTITEHRDVLLAATRRRDTATIMRLLDVDIGASLQSDMLITFENGDRRRVRCLEAAALWGNISILQALHTAFPRRMIPRSTFIRILKERNFELSNFLAISNMVSSESLSLALLYASEERDEELFHRLVGYGADPTTAPNLGAACARLAPDMLPFLVTQVTGDKHGAGSYFGPIALRSIIRRGAATPNAVACLLGLKIPGINIVLPWVNDEISHGLDFISVLGSAIEKCSTQDPNDISLVKQLIDAGCDVNSIVLSPYSGILVNQTALLLAIKTNNQNLVQLLIQSGADIKRPATLGIKRTPLQQAAETQNLEIVSLLLSLGVDPNEKPATQSGATALQLAAISGNINIAATLLDFGADITAKPSDVHGRWPLEGAAEHNRIDMIEYLWGLNDAVFNENQCRNAMRLAEENGHIACRDLIKDLMAQRVTV